MYWVTNNKKNVILGDNFLKSDFKFKKWLVMRPAQEYLINNSLTSMVLWALCLQAFNCSSVSALCITCYLTSLFTWHSNFHHYCYCCCWALTVVQNYNLQILLTRYSKNSRTDLSSVFGKIKPHIWTYA